MESDIPELPSENKAAGRRAIEFQSSSEAPPWSSWMTIDAHANEIFAAVVWNGLVEMGWLTR